MAPVPQADGKAIRGMGEWGWGDGKTKGNRWERWHLLRRTHNFVKFFTCENRYLNCFLQRLEISFREVPIGSNHFNVTPGGIHLFFHWLQFWCFRSFSKKVIFDFRSHTHTHPFVTPFVIKRGHQTDTDIFPSHHANVWHTDVIEKPSSRWPVTAVAQKIQISSVLFHPPTQSNR